MFQNSKLPAYAHIYTRFSMNLNQPLDFAAKLATCVVLWEIPRALSSAMVRKKYGATTREEEKRYIAAAPAYVMSTLHALVVATAGLKIGYITVMLPNASWRSASSATRVLSCTARSMAVPTCVQSKASSRIRFNDFESNGRRVLDARRGVDSRAAADFRDVQGGLDVEVHDEIRRRRGQAAGAGLIRVVRIFGAQAAADERREHVRDVRRRLGVAEAVDDGA